MNETMKTILPIICLALALESCEKKQETGLLKDSHEHLTLSMADQRKDIAELYLVYFQGVEIGEMRVGKLRTELEAGPDAGKAQLLAIDLKTEMAELEETKAKMKLAYGEWLDTEVGEPNYSDALDGYKTALIKARVAAVLGDEEEFERLRGLDFAAVMVDFQGK